MVATHTHRAVHGRTVERPFWGCVAVAGRCNERAHGDRELWQECRCGATRKVAANGGHREVGPWEAAQA